MKVKLVGIAKDEGAYLAEWVHHHLYFGFDAIEVWTNRIEDNSREILSILGKKYPVTDVDADYLLRFAKNSFQRTAYGIAFEHSKNQGYDYVMFLDIDEFWVPKDFKTNIKEFLTVEGTPLVMVFNWALKVEDGEFNLPVQECNTLKLDHHIKTIVCTQAKITDIFEHSVVQAEGDALLPGGIIHVSAKKNQPKTIELPDSIPDAFILHRYLRGQMEYVSLLGRGNPDDAEFTIKENRFGFRGEGAEDLRFNVESALLKPYLDDLNYFYASSGCNPVVERARGFVEARFKRVVAKFAQDFQNNEALRKKLLKGIELEEVAQLMQGKRKDSLDMSLIAIKQLKEYLNINEASLDAIRNMAIKHGKSDESLLLLKLAKLFRPDGILINQKIAEYSDE